MSIAKDIAILRAAGAVDLSEKEGCFVKKDSSGKLVLCAAADTAPLGVVHVGGEADCPTDYILPAYPGIVRVRLSASVTVAEGALLYLDAGGTLKGGATGTKVAVACQASTGGELIDAYLITR